MDGGRAQRALAEAIGTAYLLIAVVGSGAMGQRLAPASPAVALVGSALATAAGLFAAILWLGPVSGSHFNPVVTLALWSRNRIAAAEAWIYVAAQSTGALAGVALAHAMFGMPPFMTASTARTGMALCISEAVSTFALVGIVLAANRSKQGEAAAAGAVACFIGGAFWFTPTDFANPAATLARALTATVSGIRLEDAAPLIASQLAGAGLAIAVMKRMPVHASGPDREGMLQECQQGSRREFRHRSRNAAAAKNTQKRRGRPCWTPGGKPSPASATRAPRLN